MVAAAPRMDVSIFVPTRKIMVDGYIRHCGKSIYDLYCHHSITSQMLQLTVKQSFSSVGRLKPGGRQSIRFRSIVSPHSTGTSSGEKKRVFEQFFYRFTNAKRYRCIDAKVPPRCSIPRRSDNRRGLSQRKMG